MKNLVIERDHCVQLGLGEDGAPVGFCINATDSTIYVITQFGFVHSFRAGENPTALWRYPLEWELLSKEDVADVLDGQSTGGLGPRAHTWLASFTYVLELDALCIATRGGAIALLHVGDGSTRYLEQVGDIDGGVACLEWSPDGELLAILSGTGNLLVMNQAWELLSEGPALGPSAAEATAAAYGENSSLFQDALLSWRGDGKFFAVVCRDPTVAVVPGSVALPPYRIRIWDRGTLELHAAGEPADGIIPLPAWQPNGRHLYVPALATGAMPSGTSGASDGGAVPSILLYERNGLRHGGFNLPSKAPVRRLAWSCDSELLAVVTAPDPEGPNEWSVQLWHRSNWHWYLKHERRYVHSVGGGAAADLGPQLRWDEQHGGVLHVLTPGGVYETVGVAWDTCVSERGTAVVVDGRGLLLTPLRHGLVPPPMCAARVDLPEAAVDVAIAALPAPRAPSASTASSSSCWEDHDEVVAALTSSGRLLLARSVEEDLWQETLEDQEALLAEGYKGSPGVGGGGRSGGAPAALLPAAPVLDVPLAGGRRARAVCWMYGSSSLLVLASPYPEPGLEDGAGDVLVQVDVEWVSSGPADPTDPRVSPEVRLTEHVPVYAGARVLRLAPHTAGGVAVQLARGAVARFTRGAAALVSCGPAAAFKMPCPIVRSTPALLRSAGSSAEEQLLPPLVGLSRTGMLCWGSAVIATADVTSGLG